MKFYWQSLKHTFLCSVKLDNVIELLKSESVYKFLKSFRQVTTEMKIFIIFFKQVELMESIANEILSICNDVLDTRKFKICLSSISLLTNHITYFFGMRKLIISPHIYIDPHCEELLSIIFQL